MPRVYTIKKARASKRRRVCRTCAHEIMPGETYRYFEPRFGPPVMYCAQHYPRRSHMTTSKLGTLYDVQDDFVSSGFDTVEELQDALNMIAETAREVAEEYEESISNMPEGLQDSSPAAEDMREKIDALEAYADELESFSPDVEEFDADNVRAEVEHEVAQQMIEDMDLDLLRTRVNVTLNGMDARDIVSMYGDESEFASRVDDAMIVRRDEWNEEHGDEIDNARSEADDLVANFDY